MKADLHAHTHFSRDAVTSIETFAKRYEQAGIDVVAVSDHNNVDGALAVNDIASFRVIIAEEIKSTEGEIIGLFLQETVRKGLSPEDTVRAIREQGGLVLIHHPYDRLRGSPLREEALLRIMPDVDVIEVFNARTTFQGDDDVTGDDTDRKNLNILDKGVAGDESVELGALDLATGTDLDANDPATITTTASVTVRAIGPAVSRSTSRGDIPVRLIIPGVTRMPTRLLAPEGRRIDPPVSSPIPTVARLAEIAAPVPPLEPPESRSSA